MLAKIKASQTKESYKKTIAKGSGNKGTELGNSDKSFNYLVVMITLGSKKLSYNNLPFYTN